MSEIIDALRQMEMWWTAASKVGVHCGAGTLQWPRAFLRFQLEQEALDGYQRLIKRRVYPPTSNWTVGEMVNSFLSVSFDQSLLLFVSPTAVTPMAVPLRKSSPAHQTCHPLLNETADFVR
jgi:hypothetical protein